MFEIALIISHKSREARPPRLFSPSPCFIIFWVFFQHHYWSSWCTMVQNISGPRRTYCTGPVARPFASLLPPLTHSLATPCSLRLHAPLRSFARSLTDSLPVRVYSYTKLSPIVLSQENSQERWVSWAELLLLGQNLFIFRFSRAKNYFH